MPLGRQMNSSNDKPPGDSEVDRQMAGYWHANVRLILILLAIWAMVSYGCSIMLIETLNQWTFGKLPLGFWFCQQGAIYIFVVLIFVYAFVMDRIDQRWGVRE